MTNESLLVELGTEELPPKALKALGLAFRDGIERGLSQRELGYGEVQWFATPRRLAVLILAVQLEAPEKKIEVLGPPADRAKDNDGNWTAAAAGFARKQGIDNRGWQLLSISPEAIKVLSEELGFEFFSSPNGFDHITQATVIDAEGRIYRQVYGEVFETPLLVEPLKELVLGQPKPNQTMLSELIDKVRFFCTTYDPARDAYHFDYSLFIGMAIGASIILIAIILVVREVRQGRHSART